MVQFVCESELFCGSYVKVNYFVVLFVCESELFCGSIFDIYFSVQIGLHLT